MDYPTIEPAEIVAGDTISWVKNLPDYPPYLWTLTYSIKGPSDIQDITSTSYEGVQFLVVLLASVTKTWTPGPYWMAGYVSKGSGNDAERHRIFNGQISIVSDLSVATAGFDGRSHVKRVLDALEATILSKASKDASELDINGVKIVKLKPSDLITWHSHYQRLYSRELASERLKNGLGAKRKVKVRFTA